MNRATEEIRDVGKGSGEGRSADQERLVGVSRSLLNAEEVARMLGVPKSWVYQQSRAGRIPTVTLGRYRRYRADVIARWIEQLEAGR